MTLVGKKLLSPPPHYPNVVRSFLPGIGDGLQNLWVERVLCLVVLIKLDESPGFWLVRLG